MGSAPALAVACARSRLRARGALALLVLGPALLAYAAFAAHDVPGAAPAVEHALVVAFLLAAAVAAASGADLPLARATGHGEWFATLAPSAVARRLAPLLCGLALTIAAGIAASGLAAGFLAAAGRTVPTYRVEPVAVPGGAFVSGPGRPALALDLAGGAGTAGDTLELDLRPRLRDPEASAIPTVPLLVAFDGAAAARFDAPPRGTFPVPWPAGKAPRRVTLALEDDAHLRLAVDGARVRGAPVGSAATVFFAGLLLTLAAACVVPSVVLCSRATSAPTAIAAGVVLLLLGVGRTDLLAWADDLRATGGGAFAGSVLRAATSLAPDLSAAHAAGDAALGRAVGGAAFAELLPAALHAAVATGLAALLPGRARGAP